MPTPLVMPRDGLPPLCSTPADFHTALAKLAAGHGPIAIDAERASGIRYGDRAFLIQLRRAGAGTWLFDPEQYRRELGAILAPLLNTTPWVVHAAVNDLPSLQLLGWAPLALFDTEIAGRLAGYEHVNLGAMVERVLGLTLTKGLAHSDWSKRPIPEKWLIYAALDVEVLLELADSMRQILENAGKLEWAEQEFQHVLEQAKAPRPPATWRDMSGIHKLTRPAQLAVAQALWSARDNLAKRKDLAPGRVLRNQVLFEIAKALPNNPEELLKIPGFPRRNKALAYRWFRVISSALRSPKTTWPTPQRSRVEVPLPRSNWAEVNIAAGQKLAAAKKALSELAKDNDLFTHNILPAALLKETVWRVVVEKQFITPDQIREFFAERGVRPWQINLVMPALEDVFFAD